MPASKTTAAARTSHSRPVFHEKLDTGCSRLSPPSACGAARVARVAETVAGSAANEVAAPMADPLPYADSMVNTGGTSMSRLGIFRLNAPEHFDDVAELYNGRARRHRDEAAAMQPIPTHETNPMS